MSAVCKPLFWLLFSVACAHCGSRASRHIRPAFYSWQTRYQPDSSVLACLDAARCQALYLKIFDIGRDPSSGAVQPCARLEIADTAGLRGREIIPCIFIANAVFESTGPEPVDRLAAKIAVALREHPVYNLLEPGWELQFDCDWTAGTRAAFFHFLRRMRTQLPRSTRLSATIRLHQYKYPDQTGVPPLDRGMLMFYNTGDIDDPDENNSIFDYGDAKQYLNGAPRHYPLPLDVALPIFSWSLVYRDGALWKIIPGLQPAELADTAFFQAEAVERAAAARPAWTVRRPTLREGHYLRPGDFVRWEALSPAQLRDVAGLAAQFDLAPDARAAFFHLDPDLIRRFPAGYLHDVFRILEIQ